VQVSKRQLYARDLGPLRGRSLVVNLEDGWNKVRNFWCSLFSGIGSNCGGVTITVSSPFPTLNRGRRRRTNC
jgi:hypothetical protein